MDQGIISDSLPTQNPTDPWDERSIYYKCLIFYGQLVGKYYTYDIVPWIRHGKYNPPPPKKRSVEALPANDHISHQTGTTENHRLQKCRRLDGICDPSHPKNPQGPLERFEPVWGPRSSSQKMRGQAKAPTSSGEGHDLKCLSDRRNF